MTQNIEEGTREQVALFLPLAIKRAANSYRDFMEKPAPLDPKDFSDHHKAGKVAVSHLELLLKLARWADLPGDSEAAKENGLEDMLKLVQTNVERHDEQYNESGDK